MPTHSLSLFASRGPLGPTYATCFLLPIFLLGPFLLLAVAARSLLSAEPVRGWLLAVAALGTAGVGYVLWGDTDSRHVAGFWVAWRVAGLGAVLLFPLVLLREAVKRGWVSWRR